MTSLGQTSKFGSNLYFTGIAFNFLIKKVLYLYSLDNQHVVDLFHVMCYQCCLLSAKFAAHIAWTDSVTFAILDCTLYHKSLLVP